jgi:hypothetical protein
VYAGPVAGCDSGPKAPPPDILKGHRQQMDRAKDVEKVLQQSAEQRRDQADSAGK